MKQKETNDPILTRVDFYYNDGSCKTAVGEQAANFQSNFNKAVIEVSKGEAVTQVKFEEKKLLSSETINDLAKEHGKKIYWADLSQYEFEISLSQLIEKALQQQKIATLKDLVQNCESNGYQLLFDLAALLEANTPLLTGEGVPQGGTGEVAERRISAAVLIKQAAKLLL